MKICKYCGIPTDSVNTVCFSCGGIKFTYRCEGCGTHKFYGGKKGLEILYIFTLGQFSYG